MTDSPSSLGPHFRDRWSRAMQPGWNSFHKNWWATPKRMECQRIVRVEQEEIWQAFNLLGDSRGSILVREDYKLLYDRLLDAADPSFDRTGAIIIGQPGVGNSYFAVYALLRRMAEGKRVLFSTTLGKTYMFDGDGVWDEPRWDFDFDELPDRAWSLIDPCPDKLVKKSAMLIGKTFAVVVASPNKELYAGWLEDMNILVCTLIAEPWNVEEVRTLISRNAGLLPPEADIIELYETPESVERLVADVGPCPRDIVSYLSGPAAYTRDVSRAIGGIDDIVELRELFEHTERFPHHLLLARRRLWSPQPLYDIHRLTFKTRQIARRVMDRVQYLRNEAADIVLGVTRAASPYNLALRATLFEILALNHASGHTSELATDGVHPMARLAGPAHRFQHTAGHKPEHTITVSDDGRVALASAGAAAPEAPSTRASPIAPRIPNPYTTSADFPLDPTHFYLADTALFDGFFLERTVRTATVWAVRAAAAKEPSPDARDGFGVLNEIAARVSAQFPDADVDVKYLLVAPLSRQGVVVQWDMSDGWDKAPGDVWVLYLDIDRFSTTRYEQLY